MGSTPLQIRFDEIDGFINNYSGITYLALFSNNNLVIIGMIKFVICELNILQVKQAILQIVLTIILPKSELIHIILYLLKNKVTFHNAIILYITLLLYILRKESI